MVTEQEIQGGWNQLKGEAKKKWGQLSEDELLQFEGSTDQFIGLLQRKTGEAKESVQNWVKEMNDQAGPMFDRARQTASQYAESIGHAASDGVERVRDNIAAGQTEAVRMVRRRPAESVAIAFGAGLIAGVIVALTTRSR
ncbi:CsbD family protein [Botrimarina mediterranea]|uniref:CsbD-like domain-containing protein n=1 Tax=Botrimarina mediterranea TaxID=2528022 RepID=A0A518K375_9BACT|nr:CsbD family protein [Botrimarina mediterranea]QDV72256.1 hypothetical protein Spa11_04290 [Botrimarina mediterranea]QDV76800.1 hypothetical protein K2D_03820 [Planctomycetes bacterium K2D]